MRPLIKTLHIVVKCVAQYIDFATNTHFKTNYIYYTSTKKFSTSTKLF